MKSIQPSESSSVPMFAKVMGGIILLLVALFVVGYSKGVSTYEVTREVKL